MSSALARSAPPPLASVLENGAPALFLDFDGTLVDIAPGPDDIAPITGLGARLAALSDRLQGRCAIVSGRALDDIERHLGPLELAIAGSHGADIRTASGERLGEGAKSLPAEIEAALRAFAAQNDLDYEHKAHGGALHYRRNPAKGERAQAFARELAHRYGWKAQSGKCVIEIVARGYDKGSAVQTFMSLATFASATPFFLGDDLTDEAGFAACQGLGGAGILIGDREQTCAQYRLTDVSSVHHWLEI